MKETMNTKNASPRAEVKATVLLDRELADALQRQRERVQQQTGVRMSASAFMATLLRRGVVQESTAA